MPAFRTHLLAAFTGQRAEVVGVRYVPTRLYGVTGRPRAHAVLVTVKAARCVT